ncbi:MAG: SPOR domain-containing protein [Bacteroidales bacterium]|nr:SPOR domain-containing protein [Bacteroidales bacterium]
MKKKCCYSLLLLCCLSIADIKSQAPADIFAYFTKSGKQGNIDIIQEHSIKSQVNVHLSQQVKLNGIKGYRISIYFGSGQDSKKTAELTRANFVSRYSDVNCHTKFEYPYFKVYVGDFRTRSEALKFLKQIEFNYPDAFIREDIIEFPE